jgi:ribosomal protein S18 acetylase RimI-like enzyme
MIRLAEIRDARAIILVWQAAFNEKVKPKTVMKLIEDPERITQVCEHNGLVVGFIAVHINLDPSRFNMHYVARHPFDAPAGTGTALIMAAEQASVGAGATHLCLAVRRHNDRAFRLYQHLGYRVTEERAAGYSMRKELRP